MQIHDLEHFEASNSAKIIGSIGVIAQAGASASATGQFVVGSVVASTVTRVVTVKYR